MDGYREEEEEQFFDTRDEITSSSDFDSDSDNDSRQYEVWVKNPDSVRVRRNNFFKLMGLSMDQSSDVEDESGDLSLGISQLGVDEIGDDDGEEVSGDSGVESGCLLARSSLGSESSSLTGLSESGSFEEKLACTIRNLDNGNEFVVDELDHGNGLLSRLCKVGFDQSLSFEEFKRNVGSSALVQRIFAKYSDESRNMVEMSKKMKRNWLKRLNLAARVGDGLGTVASKANDFVSSVGRMHRVKVHAISKKFKELSSLYRGQEFLAHKGSILTMKFSLDGKFLATGGEDGVVRVWKVIEGTRLDQLDIVANDTSSVYFTMDDDSKLSPLDVAEKKNEEVKKHSRDSTCVVFPPKVFKVLEKPLHEFQGHDGEVLNLSWSMKQSLLSSSTDKTIRLWQVGEDKCLRVFPHNNYVTCVHFNPVDDNIFISGSIDGKVRIWEVSGCKVVDYTDIKEIVSAVSYRPEGKGAVVGTMTGNCFFYDIVDDQLQLTDKKCLQGKKNLPGKRIISFEFSPNDPSKVVVTSADSVIRVLSGMDVICKYKVSSLRLAANHTFASFTPDGKHIVATSEDSNIYVWNCSNQEKTSEHVWNCSNQEKTTSGVKKIKSYENFMSDNASIAITWGGFQTKPGVLISPTSAVCTDGTGGKKCGSRLDCFSIARGFPDPLVKGGATWPEERLSCSSTLAATSMKCKSKSKSKYKLLKNACQTILSSSHMWDHVIVSAGWDGRIRTYLNYGLPLRL